MCSLLYSIIDAGEWAGLSQPEDCTPYEWAATLLEHLIDGKGAVYLDAPTPEELTAANLLADGDLRIEACKRVKTSKKAMDESHPPNSATSSSPRRPTSSLRWST